MQNGRGRLDYEDWILERSRRLQSFSASLCHHGEQRATPTFQLSQMPLSCWPIPLPLPRAFQEASELPVSGQLDDATSARMRQPRCGLEDPFNQKTLKYLLLGEK